jgi:hypothetical protein
MITKRLYLPLFVAVHELHFPVNASKIPSLRCLPMRYIHISTYDMMKKKEIDEHEVSVLIYLL